PPTDEPWAWGPVTARQWRMSPDISDDWTSPPGQPSWKEGMIDIFDRNFAHAAATAPGTYNDPDMLEVGNGGMTDAEYRTHFGLGAGDATVRDLSAHADRSSVRENYSVSVGPHEMALLRVVGTDRVVTDGFLSDQPWTYMANELGPVERNASNGGSGTGDGGPLK